MNIEYIEETYGSVSMLKIYAAAMRELITEKQVFTREELDERMNRLAIEAEKLLSEGNLIANKTTVTNLRSCNHEKGFDLNGCGMWICKSCRADITPEQNELSSKDQDTSRVMAGDSEFDSLAARDVLEKLINAIDSHGHGSSMTHPRLTNAIHTAKKFLKQTTL